jgi:hypothetical protein
MAFLSGTKLTTGNDVDFLFGFRFQIRITDISCPYVFVLVMQYGR